MQTHNDFYDDNDAATDDSIGIIPGPAPGAGQHLPGQPWEQQEAGDGVQWSWQPDHHGFGGFQWGRGQETFHRYEGKTLGIEP